MRSRSSARMPGPLSSTSDLVVRRRAARCAIAHPGLRRGVVLDRVRDQVDEDLAQAVGVGLTRARPRPLARAQAHAARRGQALRRRASRAPAPPRGSTGSSGQRRAPRSSTLRSRMPSSSRVMRRLSSWMMRRKRARLRGIESGRVEQDLGERADRGHRRAHLVAHLAQEVVLLLVEPAQALVGLPQLARRWPRAGATAPRAGGCSRARAAVSSAIFISSSRLMVSPVTTCETIARAVAAPTLPASLRSSSVISASSAIGWSRREVAARRRAGEQALRLVDADQPLRQHVQVVGRRPSGCTKREVSTPPVCGTRRRTGCPAGCSSGRGSPQQRHHDEQQRVERQAPEHRMHQRVEAGQAEQRMRAAAAASPHRPVRDVVGADSSRPPLKLGRNSV